MSRRKLTPTEIAKFKREAKKLVKSNGIKHCEALKRIAVREKYQSWWYLQHASVSKPAPTLARIIVPNYGEMPLVIAQPSKDGLGYEVRCPFCRKLHTHAVSEGSRLSHCSSGTREYYLRLHGVTGPALPWGQVHSVSAGA